MQVKPEIMQMSVYIKYITLQNGEILKKCRDIQVRLPRHLKLLKYWTVSLIEFMLKGAIQCLVGFTEVVIRNHECREILTFWGSHIEPVESSTWKTFQPENGMFITTYSYQHILPATSILEYVYP